MRLTPEAQGRLRLLPPIHRARLWRLYAEGRATGLPQRFLDLWMDGGRSILGAKGTGIGTAAKAAVDMGLSKPLPSIWERRLEKALLAAYPGYAAARFYRSEAEALAALARFLGKAEPALLDLAMRDATGVASDGDRSGAAGGADALLLRPFAEFLRAAPDAGAIGIAVPLMPCPAALAPGVILLKDAAAGPSGELVPPLLLASAVRALRELERLSSAYGEAAWKRADRRLGPIFERSGPYLYPRHPASEHDEFFRKALGAGLLVSPEHALPSILPADFDDGELAALAKALGR